MKDTRARTTSAMMKPDRNDPQLTSNEIAQKSQQRDLRMWLNGSMIEGDTSIKSWRERAEGEEIGPYSSATNSSRR